MPEALQNSYSKVKFVLSEARESEILITSITLCGGQEDLASAKKFCWEFQLKSYFISQQTTEADNFFKVTQWSVIKTLFILLVSRNQKSSKLNVWSEVYSELLRITVNSPCKYLL